MTEDFNMELYRRGEREALMAVALWGTLISTVIACAVRRIHAIIVQPARTQPSQG